MPQSLSKSDSSSTRKSDTRSKSSSASNINPQYAKNIPAHVVATIMKFTANDPKRSIKDRRAATLVAPLTDKINIPKFHDHVEKTGANQELSEVRVDFFNKRGVLSAQLSIFKNPQEKIYSTRNKDTKRWERLDPNNTSIKEFVKTALDRSSTVVLRKQKFNQISEEIQEFNLDQNNKVITKK